MVILFSYSIFKIPETVRDSLNFDIFIPDTKWLFIVLSLIFLNLLSKAVSLSFIGTFGGLFSGYTSLFPISWTKSLLKKLNKIIL